MCVTKGGVVVMDVIWRRLCVSMFEMSFICSELDTGATSEAGNSSSEWLSLKPCCALHVVCDVWKKALLQSFGND